MLNIKNSYHLVAVAFILFLVLPSSSFAFRTHLSIRTIAKKADLILIGVVAAKRCDTNEKEAIFTEIDLLVERRLAGAATDRFKIRFLGGEIDGRGMHVSDMPRFEVGQRYLLFLRDDGEPYANPLIGADQGLFILVKGANPNSYHVLTSAGHAVKGIADGKLIIGADILHPQTESVKHIDLPEVSVSHSAGIKAVNLHGPPTNMVTEPRPIVLDDFLSLLGLAGR